MKRLLLLVLIALLVPALPAFAATPDDAVDDLADRGYYVEPGAVPADEGDLSGVVASARNAGIRLMVAILDEDPAGGATAFADAIVDRVDEGTVLVLTRSDDVGVASTEFSQSESEAALDAADARGGDDVEYAATFASALTGVNVPATVATSPPPPADGGGGSGGLIVLLVIVVVLIGIVVFAVRRQNKRSKERARQDLATARTEIRAQLDAMANDILDLADTVRVSGLDEAETHYEEASATYTAATEDFEKAQSLNDFEQLAIRLDLATWQLDAAEALVAGKSVPPKPEKRETARCFFDPSHRGPFEEAEIRTSAGSKKVRVCAADAAKLRRGESPQPRMVQVGGRSVPAASAPRSHGGGGFGLMDAFSILVGGMASGIPQQWGSGRSRRRSGFSGFGGSPSRPTRSRSSSRSYSPSRSSRRSSSSRTRSSGSTRSRTGRRRRR